MEDSQVELLLKDVLQLFASKLGFVNCPEPFSSENMAKLLNFADDLSISSDVASKAKAVAICGLLSEIVKPGVNPAAAAYISKILVRVGLSPTAQMVQRQLKYVDGSTTQYLDDLGSYFDNLQSAIRIASQQVSVNDRKINLTDFQARIWRAIDQQRYIGISAPTSAGKSFVICTKLVSEFAQKSGTVIFVVPTISLVNQVSRDFAKIANESGVPGIRILKSFAKNINLRENKEGKTIFVVTQERAAAFFGKQRTLSRPFTLVVDEIQNIEQTGSDSNERSMLLLEVIHRFLEEFRPDKLIVSGPRLANLEKVLASWVDGETICEDERLPTVVNLSYSFKGIKGNRKKIMISQFVEGLPTVSTEVIDRLGIRDQVLNRSKYNDSANKFLWHLAESFESEGGSLIFSKSSNQAYRTATSLSQLEQKKFSTDSLVQYAQDTVHPKYGLAECLEKGIAYHHGKVPHHMRNAIEYAFSIGMIKKMVSTTTLMQGVNLPAKNIIIRNPELTRTRSLNAYEFSNLRGRAGRLMKDFVGRAIMIDEASFTDEEIILQTSQNKELDFTYKRKFEDHREEIFELVLGGAAVATADPSSAEMAIYIKHVLLTNGEKEAARRFKKLGIALSTSELKQIKYDLVNVNLPLHIIHSNPFWDPSDLQKLYEMVQNNLPKRVPRSPFQNLKNSLIGSVGFMEVHFPYYAKKYFDFKDQNKLASLCSFAESWAKGVPMRNLIEPLSWPILTADDVENRISTISNNIPFGLTKLLKPLVEIQDAENSILNFIEAGCFGIEHRALLSLGLPREVILRAVQEDLLTSDSEQEFDLHELLGSLWRKKDTAELSSWDSFQITEALKFEDM